MSSKDFIYETLRGVLSEDVSISYGVSSEESFPKVVYFSLNNFDVRLSNKKVSKRICYQVNFYDVKPHDLETSDLLMSISNAFESGSFNCTAWQEVIDVDVDFDSARFMYFMEVWN